MLSEEQIEILKSNNELLQLQLEDVNMILEARERELSLLRETQTQFTAFKSRIDLNLQEVEIYKAQLEKQQEITRLNDVRLEALENELTQSLLQLVKAKKELDNLKAVEADLAYTNSELQQADKAFTDLHEVKLELAKTKSLLELAQLENAETKLAMAEQMEYINLLKKSK